MTRSLPLSTILLASACSDDASPADTGTGTDTDTGGGFAALTDPLSIESGGTEVADTGGRTNSFYEVMLDPGTYQVCTDFGSCTRDVTIADGLARCDFEAGPGGGIWTCL